MNKFDLKIPKNFELRTDEPRNEIIKNKFRDLNELKKNEPKKKN